MGMRYYLPMPGGPPTRPVGGVAPVGAPGPPGPREPDAGAGAGEGRLVRTVRMPAGEGPGYIRRWAGSGGPAHPIDAGGLTARERRRADRTVPGAVRRQRLAIAVHGDEAVAVHWSALEPVSDEDERAWARALRRLAAAPAGRGWTA